MRGADAAVEGEGKAETGVVQYSPGRAGVVRAVVGLEVEGLEKGGAEGSEGGLAGAGKGAAAVTGAGGSEGAATGAVGRGSEGAATAAAATVGAVTAAAATAGEGKAAVEGTATAAAGGAKCSAHHSSGWPAGPAQRWRLGARC